MIRPIGSDAAALQGVTQQRKVEEANPGIAQRFADRLDEVSKLVEGAEKSATSMAEGGAGSVETILALSRAELALRHVVSVRNRLLESYQEVMRLPL